MNALLGVFIMNVLLQHDGLEKKHSWFVEMITVTVVATGEMYLFPCKQWLSLYVGDMQLKKTLQAQVADPEDQITGTINYQNSCIAFCQYESLNLEWILSIELVGSAEKEDS